VKRIFLIFVFCFFNLIHSQNYTKLVLTSSSQIIKSNSFFVENNESDNLRIKNIIESGLNDYYFIVETEKNKASYLIVFNYKYRLDTSCDGKVMKKLEGKIIDQKNDNKVVGIFTFSQSQFEGKCSRDVIYALVKKINEIAE
jgi:hypothetical protein